MKSKKKSASKSKQCIWYKVPEDILLIIVKPLGKPMLGKLRQVDRRLHRITTPLLFGNVYLYLNSPSIAKLVAIGHSKTLAPNVRSVTFESYNETDCHFLNKRVAILVAENDGRSENADEHCIHKRAVDKQEVEKWAKATFHRKKWNDSSILGTEPFRALGHALAHLPNLHSYTASNIAWNDSDKGPILREHLFNWTKDLCPNVESLHVFLHVLWVFLQADVRLHKLELGLRNVALNVNSFPLRYRHADMNLQHLLGLANTNAVSVLTRAELDVQAVTPHKSLVIKFLSKMKRLETLFWNMDWEVDEPELFKLHFPRLVHLRIQDGRADPKQLVPFLKRHESSLRDVEILGIEMDGYLAGWKNVMRALSELHLEGAHIHPGGPPALNFIYEMDASDEWLKASQDYVLHGGPRPTFNKDRFQAGHIFPEPKADHDYESSDGGDDDYINPIVQEDADFAVEMFPFPLPLFVLGHDPFPPPAP